MKIYKNKIFYNKLPKRIDYIKISYIIKKIIMELNGYLC